MNGIFSPIENALYQILANLQQFAINYIFGILALTFGIRLIFGLLQGRFSIIAAVGTIVFGFLAVTMGQTFWTSLPLYHQLF